MSSQTEISTATTTLSAGFVFFSQPPKSDDWYFLLGLDDYSGKWSDFGGRRNSDETEIHCAVREMIEETLCVVQLLPVNEENNTSISSIFTCFSNMLTQRDFTFRVSVDIASKRNNQHRDYCPQLSVHQISSCFSPGLLPSGFSNPPGEKRLRVCYVKYIPWQPNLPEVFAATHKSLRCINTFKDVDSKIRYIQTLPKVMQSHPAIVYEYEKCDGNDADLQKNRRIIGIRVPDEWLEKRQIAWWSLPRIQLILKNAGKHGGHIFRCGFLSTLGVIAQHFVHAARVKKQHDDEMRRKKNPFIYKLEDGSVLFDVLKRALDLDATVENTQQAEGFKITF